MDNRRTLTIKADLDTSATDDMCVVDHGLAVNEGGRVEEALVHTFSDDFPNCGLR